MSKLCDNDDIIYTGKFRKQDNHENSSGDIAYNHTETSKTSGTVNPMLLASARRGNTY